MPQQPRVLVVEDDALSRDMLSRRLGRRRITVEAVTDGAACLQRLQEAETGANPPVDLVLLDVQMPGMSGLDVLKQIRQRWTHDALPVILVTALGDAPDVVRGLEAGANDYVVKPIVFPVLLARMSVCLRIRQSVRLLMEVERQRVVIAALGEACHQLSQPMQATMMTLEGLIRRPPADPAELAAELTEVLNWTHQVGAVIHRLQAVGTLRPIPFDERMEMLDQGSPESEGERPK